jgi:hypothetical protein
MIAIKMMAMAEIAGIIVIGVIRVKRIVVIPAA